MCIPAVSSPYATDLQTEAEFLAENFLRPVYVIDFFDRRESSDLTPRKETPSASLSAWRRVICKFLVSLLLDKHEIYNAKAPRSSLPSQPHYLIGIEIAQLHIGKLQIVLSAM